MYAFHVLQIGCYHLHPDRTIIIQSTFTEKEYHFIIKLISLARLPSLATVNHTSSGNSSLTNVKIKLVFPTASEIINKCKLKKLALT